MPDRCLSYTYCVKANRASFFPRDAMLAQVYTNYGPVSMFVCLSVTSPCSVETVGRIVLVFGPQASFDLSYTVLRKLRYLQNNGASLWNFVSNSGLRKFCFGISIVLPTQLEKGGRQPTAERQQRRKLRCSSGQEISIDCCTAGAQQQMRAVSRCQLTQEAGHRLVNLVIQCCFMQMPNSHRPLRHDKSVLSSWVACRAV